MPTDTAPAATFPPSGRGGVLYIHDNGPTGDSVGPLRCPGDLPGRVANGAAGFRKESEHRPGRTAGLYRATALANRRAGAYALVGIEMSLKACGMITSAPVLAHNSAPR